MGGAGMKGRLWWVAAALTSWAADAGAQEIPPPAVAVVAGVAQYDLSGTGDETFIALRIDLPMAEYLYVEPSFGYMSYESQGEEDIRHLSAEVQVQGSWPLGRWRPYLGVGAGGFFDLRKQRGGSDLVQPAFSGATGLRVDLPSGFGARAELRVRGIETGFTGTVAEWGAGLSRSF